MCTNTDQNINKPVYQINSQENRAFVKAISQELLAFGREFPSPGGASYYLGDHGQPWKDRPRETWITSRMAHVYSIGAMLYKDEPIYKELAACALKGLTGELHDDDHDGWYAGLTADDQPLPLKQCYAHAFVILAATSLRLAEIPGAEVLLDHAMAVYDQYFWNEAEGLSCDNWDTAFQKMDTYRGINANMHTVEAFLAVADAHDDADVRKAYRIRAGRVIDHVLGWAETNEWRIPEHFTEDWLADLECNADRPDDPFKPYGATPGHGIEWARLITQWALSSLDQEASSFYVKKAQLLYNRAIADAWNADGQPGIVYTTDWQGNPVVHDRMHWTLAEAINTSAVLYRVTGDDRYARDYAIYMQYLDEYVLDHEKGSWYHQLDENNQLKETVWPGKSDIYHAFQSMLIPYADPSVSIAAAIKNSFDDEACF